MKIAYLGVIRDNTGYGHAAVDTILAMDSVGLNVVPRTIKLNSYIGPVHKRILELEQKDLYNCTHVIQHLLPHQMVYKEGVKNIGIYDAETHSFGDTSWARHLNLMDEIWVINNQMKNTAIAAGVVKPIHIVPHPIDTDKFQGRIEPLQIPHLEGKFLFYFIGEMNRRKNLAALLRAFHTEFDRAENVGILLKVLVSSSNPVEDVKKYCNDIKNGLKLYKNIDSYIPEVIITDYLTDYQILQVHATGNCFVMPSYGEAWSIPTADALGMGKTPIVTSTGGMKELINNECGWLVSARKEPCFGVTDTFEDLYTSHEQWDSIDTIELQMAMREAYSDPILKKKKSLFGLKRIYNFSYNTIGSKIKDLL